MEALPIILVVLVLFAIWLADTFVPPVPEQETKVWRWATVALLAGLLVTLSADMIYTQRAERRQRAAEIEFVSGHEKP